MYSAYLAFLSGDLKAFWWIPKPEDVPEKLIVGPPVCVDGADNRPYALYLQEGSMMLPNDLERAKELTEKMKTLEDQETSSKEVKEGLLKGSSKF